MEMNTRRKKILKKIKERARYESEIKGKISNKIVVMLAISGQTRSYSL